MGSQEDRIALAVAQRAGQGASATLIADAIVDLWEQLESVLAPIIGQRGVAALYARSRHLAGAGHPWLRLRDDPQGAMDLASLKAAIARQDSADAAAGGIALLQTFHTLLTSLIGSSLTARLLETVWTHALPPAVRPQDPSP